MNLQNLLEEVKAAAVEAAAMINEGGNLDVKSKGPKDFVTSLDLRISKFLCRRLPELLPGSLVVSEEEDEISSANSGGSSSRYQWIIDPVDGTTNLIYGLPLYAVSIGLLQDAKPVLGVVYNPAGGELFSAAEGLGAWLGDQQIRVNRDPKLSVTLALTETDPYMDRDKNLSPELIRSVFNSCIDYRITGSAALDICYIAAGRGGVFFSQTLKPWDYAAGSSLIREAGGSISRWDGSPIPFTGKHSVLASNGLIHKEMLDLIGEFLSGW
jgi:myo-inositol-1(or 4)-monophosphatase